MSRSRPPEDLLQQVRAIIDARPIARRSPSHRWKPRLLEQAARREKLVASPKSRDDAFLVPVRAWFDRKAA